MKRILSALLALCMVISLAPMVFAAVANTVVYPDYEYVFNNAAHGIDNTLATETGMEVNALRNVKSGYHTVERTVPSASSGRWGFVNIKTTSGHSTNTDNFVWHFESSAGKVPMFTRDANSQGVSMAIAFEIELPTAGLYKPEIKFQEFGASPKFDVYLIEKPASQDEIEEWQYSTIAGDDDVFFKKVRTLGANEYLGSVDFYGNAGADTVTTDSTSLRPISLAAGSYYLILVGNGVNDNWAVENHENGNTYIRTKLNSFKLGAVTEPIDLEYNTTISAFDTSNMFWTTDSSLYAKEGYVRKADNGLLYTASLSWQAESSLNEKGETLDPAVRIMNLSLTDPWEFAYEHGSSRLTGKAAFGLSLDVSGYHSSSSGDFTSLRLRVPHSGKYILSIKNANKSETGAYVKVWMGKDVTQLKSLTDSEKKSWGSVTAGLPVVGEFNFSTANAGEYTEVGEVELEAGDNLIVLAPTALSRAKNPMTSSGDITAYIDSETGAISTALTAKTYYQYMYMSGIKLTAVEDTLYEDAQVEYAANLAAYNDAQNADKGEVEAVAAPNTAKITLGAVDINGNAVTGASTSGNGTYSINDSVTVSARDVSGYRFSHWAVGINGMVVSAEKEYTFTAGSSTRLTAIYVPVTEAETTKVIYYAADGSRIDEISVDSGSEITLPATPKVVGGTSSKWQGTDEKLYDANSKVTVSGDMVAFVADFAADTYTITANGTISNANPKYGELVTIEADSRENVNTGNSFNYWQDDNGEIVSFDRKYSFYAWRDCEYTAVYKQFEPINKTLRKIIISDNDSHLMAEFIGFNESDIVERGILFGEDLSTFSAKAVMKTDAKQFAVYNDLKLNAVGYAILTNGDVIYSK